MGHNSMIDYIHIIGDGCAFAEDLNCTSFFFIKNDSCYLFECSYDTYKFIKTNKQIFSKCKRFIICISHNHEDHVGGLGSFIFYLQFVLNITPDRIFIVCPSIKEINNYISVVAGNCFYKQIRCTRKLINSDVEITTIDTTHAPMACCGFLVKDCDSSFFYTGDTNTLNDDIVELYNNNELDLLIGEVTLYESPVHLQLDEYVKKIGKNNLDRIKFVHFDSQDVKNKINKFIEGK